eukprot:3747211-Alexandrium_andersonii.AAC.1
MGHGSSRGRPSAYEQPSPLPCPDCAIGLRPNGGAPAPLRRVEGGQGGHATWRVRAGDACQSVHGG